MIRITSKQNNFRRCGIPHPAAPTDYQDDRFTTEQLAILKAEPMLVVEDVPDQTGATGKEDSEIGDMTVEQLRAEISAYQPVETLKGVKKAELVEILKAHREKETGA